MSCIVEELVRRVRSAAVYNPEVQVAPACILWPDRERQWEPIVPRLQAELPEMFVLGDYDPAKRRGPAIWLRCVLAGKFLEELPERIQEGEKDLVLPKTPPPIFYLPGVGRQDLRAVETCPELLKPLAELQYRGTIWSQINAKDWTIFAFLKSDQGGLGLDVARDAQAKRAMQLALYRLLDEEIDLLRGKRLGSDYFNKLLTSGDPTREILQWIDQGAAFKESRGENEWQAFVEVTRSQLGFDPTLEGEISAAEKLAMHEGAWQPVWERFCEAPGRYPNIPGLIRRCSPPDDFFANRSGWPQLNDRAEEDLEKSLLKIGSMAAHQARKRVRELDQEHGSRRTWVWAELGDSPLANAAGHLAEMARVCEQSLAVGGLEDVLAIYMNRGWEADWAVLRALAAVEKREHREAVTAAVRAVYLPWLEEGARHLQALVADEGYPRKDSGSAGGVKAGAGEVYLFVDALRYDLGKQLVKALEERQHLSIDPTTVWAALPSVTATAKPAISPVAHKISGADVSADFEPIVAETGQSLKGGYHFERLLKEEGWQVLSKAETGDPAGAAWTEIGDIDREGHESGSYLANEADRLIREIVDRIDGLIAAGWRRIHVVTDHGFLLMPDGLPGKPLSSVLAENAWGRCAALKPGARSDEAHFSWFWNPSHAFALPDGIGCYGRKREYSHGGISLQECLVPNLTVQPRTAPLELRSVEVTDHVWRGMRLTVAIEGGADGLKLDLRKHAGTPSSTVVMKVKPFQESGKASVVVEDDSLVSERAYGVILDEAGRLVAQFETAIGGDE